MNILKVEILVLTLLTTIICALTFTDINPPETSSKRWRYTRSHDLYEVYCLRCDLDTIPQNMNKGIEKMDFRLNQLGRLSNGSLDRYIYLQEIYFQKNGMAIIEELAFEPTKELKILDLSYNQLKELPHNIFTLPNLRKLYLENNPLTDKVFDSVETTAPIEHLQLSYNKLTKIPKLKYLSEVKTLNLTGNSINILSVNDLASLCSLKELHVKENPIKFKNDCECKQVDQWIDIRNIKLDITLNCPGSSNCSISFSNDTLSTYNVCLSIVEERIKIRQSNIIIIVLSIITVIVIVACCAGGYYMHRRRKYTGTSKSRSTQTIPPVVTTVS